MSNRFSLFVCLALSLIAHGTLILLAGYPVSPGIGDLQTGTANFPLQATLLQSPALVSALPDAGPESLLVAPEPEEGHATNREVGQEAKSLSGEDEQKPVVRLSVDDYLPRSRLERIPKLIGSVDTSANFEGMLGLVGEAEIIVLISSDGGVDDVLVAESTLPKFLVDKMIAAFKGARYEPGMVGGLNVRSRLRIRFSAPSNDEILGNPSSARERAWR